MCPFNTKPYNKKNLALCTTSCQLLLLVVLYAIYIIAWQMVVCRPLLLLILELINEH